MLEKLFTKVPSLGYIGSGTSFGVGLMSLVETATKIGGLLTMCLGLAVGVYTFRIQRRAWLKAREQDERNAG